MESVKTGRKLFIKKKGCYSCQRAHMIVELKNLRPEDCQVIAEEDKGKIEREHGVTITMWPTLLDDHTYDDGEEIEQHLEKYFLPSLKSDDNSATKLAETSSPISDFNKWFRAENPALARKHAENLAKFLKEADKILGENGKKGDFLDGNSLKSPDCILLPKLYHMREVGKLITNDKGDILKGFTNLERYMKKAENGTAFQKTRKPIDDRKWMDFRSKTKSSSEIYNALK